jgi:hypothetical protein
MHDRIRPLSLLVVACVFAMGGCPPRGSQPIPDVDGAMVTAAQKRWPDSNRQQLQRGHDVLVTRCTRCHSRPGPNYKSADKWEPVVNRMAKKAKLDDASRNDLLKFLIAARESGSGK